ncbi:MAG TPA: hypothetical protein VMF06_11455 [Candidatus Limnocylindria bacterium]|nr:hypothetical protein [Candidatus Limnocylindria bacterium]
MSHDAPPHSSPPSEQDPPGPETAVFEDRSRWLWIVTLLAVLLAVGAYVASRPAYRAFKSWRAQGLVSEGYKALENRRIKDASRSVRSALGLAPRDAAVLRFAARYCAEIGSPQGLNYWQQLMATGSATDADRQAFARFAQDVGRFDLAGEQIQSLIAHDANDPTNQLLVIDQHVLLRNWGPAIRGAEIYLQRHPNDPLASYLLARAVMLGGDVPRAVSAKAILDQLARGSSPQRRPALRTLAGIQGLPKEELNWIAKQLKDTPGMTVADQLQVIDLGLRAEPASVAQRLHEVGGLLEKPENIIDTQALVGWLRVHRGQSNILASIPLERAKTNETLSMHRIEALADLSRWKEVASMVSDPGVPLSPVARHCAEAMLSGARGDSAAVAKALQEASSAAANNPEQLQQVAMLALSQNLPAIAIEAAERLLTNPRSVFWAADLLLRLAKRRDDMVLERAVYGSLEPHIGSEMVVTAEKAYLDVLFEDNVSQARSRLAALFAKNPGSLAIRSILALAELRSGHSVEALSLVDGANVDWTKEETRWQVIAVVVWEANQQREAARRLSTKIDQRLLKAPERHLLEKSINAL